MRWTHDPTTDVHIRHDGLVVLRDDSKSWFARWPAQSGQCSPHVGGWDAAGWLVGQSGRRRPWPTAERAKTALDGEFPAGGEPPHPADTWDRFEEGRTGPVDRYHYEDQDRSGPVGAEAAEQAGRLPVVDAAAGGLLASPAPEPPADMTIAELEDLERTLRLRAGSSARVHLADGKSWRVLVEPDRSPGLQTTTAHLRERLRARALPPAPADDGQGAPKRTTPAEDGRSAGPAPDAPRAALPVAAQPTDSRPVTGSVGGAGPIWDAVPALLPPAITVASTTARQSTAPDAPLSRIETPGNPAGPATAAPAYTLPRPEPPATPPPVTEAGPNPVAVSNTPAAGHGGPCELLTADDQAARRVELAGGRIVQRMTSSLVPMALGLSRNGGPYAAWALATGRMEGPDDNERMRLGRRFEAPARDEYAYRHPDRRVLTVRTQTVEHWAADSADGLVVLLTGEPDATLEIKHRSRDQGWGMAGTDEVPPDVYAQALWHLWAHQVERCDVVLVVGLRLVEYSVRRHEPTVRSVVERAEEWWHRHVADDVEPPLDATPMTALAVRAVYRESTEPAMEPTPAVLELARRRAVWDARIKEAEQYRDLCDLALRKVMGNHGGIAGVLTRYTQQGRPDWKRILQDNRQINLDAYRGPAEDRVRFAYKPADESAGAETPAANRPAQAKGAGP